MKTKLFSAILLLVFCLMFSGCTASDSVTPSPSASSEYTISRFSVEYDIEDGTHKVIRVNFENSEVTVKYFSSDETAESSEYYAHSDELSEFLEETVIPSIEKSDSEYNNDDEKITWVVRITTEDDTLVDEGFEGDGYPEYWQNLLKYFD